MEQLVLSGARGKVVHEKRSEIFRGTAPSNVGRDFSAKLTYQEARIVHVSDGAQASTGRYQVVGWFYAGQLADSENRKISGGWMVLCWATGRF